MRRESAPINEMLTIGLMAKYWQVGKVKTRLGASIGMTRAARIHLLFVQHLCDRLGNTGARRTLCLAPIDRRGDVLAMLRSLPTRPQWTVIDQGHGDLGQRMERWFRGCLVDRQRRAILIGADFPTIQPEMLLRADQLLRRHDVVIGPARDGGYYLIGLRGAWAEQGPAFETLFREVPWSTSEVLQLTRNRARQAKLSLVELAIGEDVDTVSELNNLLQTLGEHELALKTGIGQILDDPNLADPP